VFVFFFQAEDGIRDWSVTGVQTCALPIFGLLRSNQGVTGKLFARAVMSYDLARAAFTSSNEPIPRSVEIPFSDEVKRVLQYAMRSEERRVGKEGRTWW